PPPAPDRPALRGGAPRLGPRAHALRRREPVRLSDLATLASIGDNSMTMRRLLTLALPLMLVTSLTTAASADVARPGKCKCSAVGAPAEGALCAGMLSVTGLLVVVARGRRRR